MNTDERIRAYVTQNVKGHRKNPYVLTAKQQRRIRKKERAYSVAYLSAVADWIQE